MCLIKLCGLYLFAICLFQLMEIKVGVLGGSAVEALTKNINSALYQRSQHYLVPTTNDAIKMLM